MSRQHLSHADQTFVGKARSPGYEGGKHGIELTHVYWYDLGAPAATDADALIKAATSTELPDTETVTYTAASNTNSSPADGVISDSSESITTQDGTTVTVWTLDVPRNVVSTVTHASSVVAMTIVVTGYDQYFAKMSETLTVAATGTSQVDAGKKAFKYIESIAITAAADAEANTLNFGTGDVFGLPFAVGALNKVILFANNGVEDAAAFVAADTNTATATTGDVRGTVDPTTAADATATFAVWMVVDRTSDQNAFGVTQFAG